MVIYVIIFILEALPSLFLSMLLQTNLLSDSEFEQAMTHLALLSRSSISTPIHSIAARPLRVPSRDGNITSSFLNFKTQSLIPGKARRVLVFAERDSWEEYKYKRDLCLHHWVSNAELDIPLIFVSRWIDPTVPESDNFFSIGSIILLTWISGLVFYHLFFPSVVIFVGAMKYSILAALLIFSLFAILLPPWRCYAIFSFQVYFLSSMFSFYEVCTLNVHTQEFDKTIFSFLIIKWRVWQIKCWFYVS